MVGAVRKPRHGEAPAAPRGGYHESTHGQPSRASGLNVNPLIMQSRPIRDALLHVRWARSRVWGKRGTERTRTCLVPSRSPAGLRCEQHRPSRCTSRLPPPTLCIATSASQHPP